MRTINSNQTVTIPKGVSAKVHARVVTVYGPRGKLSKSFRHLAMDIYKVSKKKLMVEKWFGAKKEIAAVRTVCSHIENMIKGKNIFALRSFLNTCNMDCLQEWRKDSSTKCVLCMLISPSIVLSAKTTA